MPEIAYANYHIKPSDINISKLLQGAFNKLGVEILACAIILFCQSIGYWHSFDIDDLKLYCEEIGANTAFLKILLEHEYIAIDKWDRVLRNHKIHKKML